MTEERRAQAVETRIRNQAAQARRYEEQAESIKVARLALQRIMESTDATTEQVLEATKLLVELCKH